VKNKNDVFIALVPVVKVFTAISGWNEPYQTDTAQNNFMWMCFSDNEGERKDKAVSIFSLEKYWRRSIMK